MVSSVRVQQGGDATGDVPLVVLMVRVLCMMRSAIVRLVMAMVMAKVLRVMPWLIVPLVMFTVRVLRVL